VLHNEWLSTTALELSYNPNENGNTNFDFEKFLNSEILNSLKIVMTMHTAPAGEREHT
jgi:hypothetical protein